MNKPTAPMAGAIRAVLEGAGLTPVAIADVPGIEQPAISKRYRGATPWRAHELQALSEAFDIPVERFYGRPTTTEKAAS